MTFSQLPSRGDGETANLSQLFFANTWDYLYERQLILDPLYELLSYSVGAAKRILIKTDDDLRNAYQYCLQRGLASLEVWILTPDDQGQYIVILPYALANTAGQSTCMTSP